MKHFWLIGLGLISNLMVLGQSNEPEPVERYRKSYAFTMPDAGKPGNDENPVIVRNFSGPSGVNYLMDESTGKLLDLHKKSNENASEVEGFRIQIYAGGDQSLANEARMDFLSKFSTEGYEIHQTWDPPHFRVRVGDFRTRAEAMNALPNIRRIFPDGFVVADKVKLRKAKKPAATHGPDGQPIAPGTGTESKD